MNTCWPRNPHYQLRPISRPRPLKHQQLSKLLPPRSKAETRTLFTDMMRHRTIMPTQRAMMINLMVPMEMTKRKERRIKRRIRREVRLELHPLLQEAPKIATRPIVTHNSSWMIRLKISLPSSTRSGRASSKTKIPVKTKACLIIKLADIILCTLEKFSSIDMLSFRN